jgi:DNA-directed RNA polymerase subunit RPC12/RpoP
MDDRALMVDGNALAGELSEVFSGEMTVARVACGGCGAVEQLGADHAYIQSPGMVLRCRHCDHVLLVMTRTGDRLRVSLAGSKWIDL